MAKFSAPDLIFTLEEKRRGWEMGVIRKRGEGDFSPKNIFPSPAPPPPSRPPHLLIFSHLRSFIFRIYLGGKRRGKA